MQHWTVGEVRIHAVVQAVIPMPASRLFGNAPARFPANLVPDYVDASGNILMAIQSYVIESARARVLIDTCFAGRFLQARGIPDRFEESLAAAGFTPGDITAVACTHLHRDHAGRNTTERAGQWVPTFPNADYLLVAAEYRHWCGFAGEDRAATECVAPLQQHGKLRLVDPDHCVTDGVRLVPSAGHTPGHVAVRIESGGSARLDGGEAKLGPPHQPSGSARLGGGEAKLGPPNEPAGAIAYISGDSVHHPVQIGDPEIAALPDVDPVAARASRERLLRRVADERALLLGSHFAAPAGGFVDHGEGGMTWQPLVDREGTR